jgi:putative glutamine amidotransferase
MFPLIGITPRILIEEGVEKQFVNTRYVDRLTPRALNTMMLTLGQSNQDELLDLCDGFLITGGTDVDPKYYGEVNLGLSKAVINRLDEIDKAVIEHAIRNKKPLLGICRGFQSINVFFGGTLHQDLGDKNEAHNRISSGHVVNTNFHPSFPWGSQILVNSYHHQAIKDLAPGLHVLATHEDGTLEMVIHETLPIFAVQWHPEITPDSPISKIIFDVFADMVYRNKKGVR